MTTTFTTLAKIEESANRIKELEEAHLALVQESLNDVLLSFGEVGVKHVLVIGFTPGFNDGEPCEHTTYFFAGRNIFKEGYEYHTGLIDDEAQEIMVELPYLYTQPSLNSAKDIEAHAKGIAALAALGWDDTEPPTAVDAAIKAVVIPALDAEFGTDYAVLYSIEDGKVKRKHNEYDCGY